MSLHPEMKLLGVESLLRCVRIIENNCPGWWWSISQRPGHTTISIGPGRNCPHQPDNEYALTVAGDNGLVDDFDYAGNRQGGTRLTLFEELNMIEHVRTMIKSLRQDRQLSGDPVSVITIPEKKPYRFQDEQDLHSLKVIYTHLLTDPVVSENETHVLSNVYIGSCDLTADCSLRGKVGEEEFDFSCDLADTSPISESMLQAYTELVEEILSSKE